MPPRRSAVVPSTAPYGCAPFFPLISSPCETQRVTLRTQGDGSFGLAQYELQIVRRFK